ncbi:MAG: hypothetical protein HY954_03490 [Deltaproteobacteria bacterium]|nr:hypothetical protein [Deltaproteobacteria bacterium]
MAEDAWVFEDKSVRITVSLFKSGTVGPALLDELLTSKYVLFRMDIDNMSKGKVMFNPGYAVLTDDELSYLKPLDFTDLYDIKGDSEGALKSISELKGRFYDLDVTVMPGDKTSKLLIFKPLSKRMKKASLAIKEMYVGTDTLKAVFPFALKEKK